MRGREFTGAAGDDQGTAGERAPAIGRAIGVAVHDADTRRLQAELVGDQLRERRGEALAVGRGTDPGFDEARRVHRHLDPLVARRDVHAARGERRSAVPGALVEHREADAEIAAPNSGGPLALAEGGDVDALHRQLQGLTIRALVVGLAGRGAVRKRLHEITPPDLHRVEAKARGGAIHQPLHGERDRRPADAAIGRHRAGVGRNAAGAHGIGLEVVRARQLRHGHQRLDAAGHGIARVRPDVAPEIGIDREQTRLGVERATDGVAVIAAVERGREILAAVLDPRDRAAQMSGRPDRHDVFRHERHLLAERAAHVRRHHAQIRLREAEHVGKPGAQHVRHLHRGGERHPTGGRIEGGVRATRFQRQRALAPRADLDLDDLGGARERRGRAGVDPPFDQDVAGGVRMDQRRASGRAPRRHRPGIFGL